MEKKSLYSPENTSELILERKKYNAGIIAGIIKLLEESPGLRFCQLLSILGLGKDENFNEEPWDTLKRLAGKS